MKKLSSLLRIPLALIVLGAALPAPASALTSGAETCQQVWGEFAHLVNDESVSGVSRPWLEEINNLIPAVEWCSVNHDLHEHVTSDWELLVAAIFAPDDVDRVLCLMELESHGDPTAVNPTSGATGLMQVMPSWAPVYDLVREDLENPLINLEVAAAILENHGWDSWSPYRRGSCR